MYGVQINNPLKTIDEFKTRKEFNQYVEHLEEFTQYKSHRYVKNDSGLVVERELYTDISKEMKKLNKRNKKRLKEYTDMDHTDRGDPTGWNVGQALYGMGDPRFKNLRKRTFNFENFNSREELIAYRESLKNMNDPKRIKRMDNQLKKNYIQALQNTFGNDANPIIRRIRSLNIAEFMRIFYTENVADFDFIYSFQQRITKLIQLANIWGVTGKFAENMANLL